MKFILIVALLGLCHVNSLPTEETLKSIEGDSDFDKVLPKGRSGKKKKMKKKKYKKFYPSCSGQFTPFYGDIFPLFIVTILSLFMGTFNPFLSGHFTPFYWDILPLFTGTFYPFLIRHFYPCLLGHFSLCYWDILPPVIGTFYPFLLFRRHLPPLYRDIFTPFG